METKELVGKHVIHNKSGEILMVVVYLVGLLGEFVRLAENDHSVIRTPITLEVFNKNYRILN